MDTLYGIAKALNRMFPSGNEPFQMIARLAEECGELAKEVNHWEGSGSIIQKYGAPDKVDLAHEIQNVMTCALQLALYYDAEQELQQSIRETHDHLLAKGYVE